jgi:FtsH-binding integral membrane protein
VCKYKRTGGEAIFPTGSLPLNSLYINRLCLITGSFHFLSFFNRQNLSLIQQLARIRLKPIVRVVKVFTVKRPDNKRQQLALVSIVLILLQVVLLGYSSVLTLYLYGRPMCLDALHVSLLSSVTAVIVLLLSLLTAFCKKSLSNTYILPIVGSLSVIIHLVIFGLAKKVWLLYIG